MRCWSAQAWRLGRSRRKRPRPPAAAPRERILASGYFATVGFHYEPSLGGKGFRATFEVAEVEPLYPLRFEDLPAPEFPAALERSDPLFGAKIPVVEPMLESYPPPAPEKSAKNRRQ